ncbi:MAG: glycoside hydrolase family 88 protein [Bacteroidaceae bacterium]|nr:glycoside hydrolase family 88 protein [Bacteroidaceae bacterium]
MKKTLIAISAFLMFAGANTIAQEVQNDATAPLHLMKPAYKYNYGVPKATDVKSTMDKIKDYLTANTYTELDASGKNLKRGTFRLTSYEWGVTYSAMLAAGAITGDASYTSYAMDRMLFLADMAPTFKKWLDEGEEIDPLMMQVVSPDALDDAGAICAAMLKMEKLSKTDKNFRLNKKFQKLLDNQIARYYNFITKKQYRYTDGQFARLRPVKNTVWLDDMFMGIPALALHGNKDEAIRQFTLFHDKMWVAEKNLYRHGWVPGDYHPSFFWGRANGWALLTACEILDCTEDPTIMAYFKQHLNGLMPLQSHDGAWHQLLDRNDTYLETSCTAIYCYCIAHAINKGWIEPEPYISQVLLAWNYVDAHVNKLGQVEGTCVGTGLSFDPAFYAYRPVNNFAAHGYGPVIWAGAEIYKLVSNNCIKMNDSAIHYYPEDPQTNEPIFYVGE